MNFFVTFKSVEDRDTFLAQLRQDWPKLLEQSYIPKRRPEAIFEHLNEAEHHRLMSLVGDRGQVHQDVQFAPFRPTG